MYLEKIVNPTDIDRTCGITVMCQGCFDLLHIGHIKHLSAAKEFGDTLVVAVTSDKYVDKGPDRPVFNQNLRMEALAALEIVDYVVLSDSPSAVPVINAVKPDYFVKGSEYGDLGLDITGKIRLEKEAVEANGGKLVFTDEITFSSTKLLNDYFNSLDENTKVFLNSLPFNSDDVLSKLEELRDLRVLVVGESIFDTYSCVEVTNVGEKHSVLCSRFLDRETHCGGVLATASHLAQFSEYVDVLTCVDNYCRDFVTEKLPSIRELKIVSIPDDMTIIKERFLDDKGKQLFRVDYMDDRPYLKYSKAIIDGMAGDYDIVLINDFGHGMITGEVVDYFESLKGKVFLALNVQTNSANKGFNLVTKYKCSDYVSMDLPEARLATHDKFSSAEVLAGKLLDIFGRNTVLSITHGKYGTKVFTPEKSVSVPVFSTESIDTTGAGDAYFAITAPLTYLRVFPEMLGLVGNAVGALAIRIMGNRESIDPVLLRKYIRTLMK